MRLFIMYVCVCMCVCVYVCVCACVCVCVCVCRSHRCVWRCHWWWAERARSSPPGSAAACPGRTTSPCSYWHTHTHTHTNEHWLEGFVKTGQPLVGDSKNRWMRERCQWSGRTGVDFGKEMHDMKRAVGSTWFKSVVVYCSVNFSIKL